MLRNIQVFLAVVFSFVVLTSCDPKIKNVVVLMLENRSFDHMIGFLKGDNPEIEGLTGLESNPYDSSDPNSERVYVNDKAPYVDPDFGHSVEDTTQQVFGAGQHNVATMNGFLENAVNHVGKNSAPFVMSCFNKTSVPVISTLASEFAILDHWYASVPGPTQVNRMYLHSGTSHGSGTNDVPRIIIGYPQKTLFRSLHEHGIDWRVFYEDTAATLLFDDMRYPDSLSRHMPFFEFERHAAAGTLPTYSFIEPRYYDLLGIPANDQHPSHRVDAGEIFIKRVYEALRSSVQWNQSLLLITYDEHGGFYDHVPTPLQDVPNPDGLNSTKPPFNFDRLGVRVPTIAISPWIKKGTVIHKPSNGTHFEHASVAATFKKWFNLTSYLTKRDQWAGTFEDIASELSSPRTDCPMTLPTPPTPHAFLNIPVTGNGPLSELQKELLLLAASFVPVELDAIELETMTEAEGADFVTKATTRYIETHRSV